jgi:alpha-glucosidase
MCAPETCARRSTSTSGGRLGPCVPPHRRVPAATLLVFALLGSLNLYQGEELCLPELVALPADVRRGAILARSGGAEPRSQGLPVPQPTIHSRHSR